MTTPDLLARLADHDVRLELDPDGGLIIDGPDDGIVADPDLVRHLQARKREIIAVLLSDWPAALIALVRRVRLDDAKALIDQFNERAAIYQFDAGHRRIVAEEIAYHELAIRLDADACSSGTTAGTNGGGWRRPGGGTHRHERPTEPS